MTRVARLLRLARLRGDRVAIATLTHDRHYVPEPKDHYIFSARINPYRKATETELRALWGDR